jgi:hypothetical protein
MSKSKKELLRQLLELEDEDVGTLGPSLEKMESNSDEKIINNETEDAVEVVEKPKKKLTEKQLEALKKGQEKRNDNRDKNRLLKQQKEEEERKILEEKLVKKAIAVKKKQIKKQALLDEISDDDGTPIQKAGKPTVSPAPPSLPAPKVPLFKFF